MRKSLGLLASLLMTLAVLVGLSATNASAATTEQFTLHSDPATAVVTIPNPPLPGTHVTVSESLLDAANQPAGSAFIDCTVVAPVPVPPALVANCSATFNLTNGTITGSAALVTLLHNYPAVVTGGTGAYANVIPVLSTVQVEDRAPGDETYHFSLTRL
jgi:hypothetical protein